ncbi:growth factor receptor-bound protein 14-like isoform X3 [Tachypleus tridentatus]
MCNKGQDDEGFSYNILSDSDTGSTYSFLFDTNKETEEIIGASDSEPGAVTITFHLENGSQQQMIVEEGLRVIDLCHLLSLKFNLARSHTWSIVEQLHNLKIERSLEDHEEVLRVFNNWDSETSDKNKFIFRQDFQKYEFLKNTQQFFPLEMVDLGSDLDCISESVDFAKLITVQNILHAGDSMPVVHSYLWLKDPSQHSWKRFFFCLKRNVLNISLFAEEEVPRQVHPFVDIQSCDIYVPIEGSCVGAPTKFCFCLKPKRSIVKTRSDLKWFCCESEKQRLCWKVALRLAKYGKKLKENYRQLKLRYGDSIETNESHQLLDYTTVTDRVAMDFTGRFGKVVKNPQEVRAIAAAEARDWKVQLISLSDKMGLQNNRNFNKRKLPACRNDQSHLQGTYGFGIHKVQPWLYSGLSREDATQLLTRYGTVDGVFLVRESRRNPGTFVLSYVYNNKIHHLQIVPVEEKTQICLSLDGGRTKFYDLLQLIEFHQLNLGCLPTKLTHFLVHQSKPKDTPP